MQRLISAAALTLTLFVTGAGAQGVTGDTAKQLWCGSALVVAFSNPPAGVLPEQIAKVQIYLDGGMALIDSAARAEREAGLSEAAIDRLKADLAVEVTDVVLGQRGDEARYTFEECRAILPATAAPAGASFPSTM